MPPTHTRTVKLSGVPVSLSCRVLLSIMYLMVETIRVQTEDDQPERIAAREAFKNELGVCHLVSSNYTRVCLHSYIHISIYPIPKHWRRPLSPQVHLCTMESPSPCSSSPWWPSSAAWMPRTSPWRKYYCCSGRQYWLVHRDQSYIDT